MANVGESGKSAQNGLANGGKSGKSAQNSLTNVGESGESCIFLKNAIVANASTRQKWQVFGEYLHLLNLRASNHCLHGMLFSIKELKKILQFLNKNQAM